MALTTGPCTTALACDDNSSGLSWIGIRQVLFSRCGRSQISRCSSFCSSSDHIHLVSSIAYNGTLQRDKRGSMKSKCARAH